jgi:hypothetical protein
MVLNYGSRSQGIELRAVARSRTDASLGIQQNKVTKIPNIAEIIAGYYYDYYGDVLMAGFGVPLASASGAGMPVMPLVVRSTCAGQSNNLIRKAACWV